MSSFCSACTDQIKCLHLAMKCHVFNLSCMFVVHRFIYFISYYQNLWLVFTFLSSLLRFYTTGQQNVVHICEEEESDVNIKRKKKKKIRSVVRPRLFFFMPSCKIMLIFVSHRPQQLQRGCSLHPEQIRGAEQEKGDQGDLHPLHLCH